MSLVVIMDSLTELFDKLEPLRSRTYETDITLKNIDKLRSSLKRDFRMIRPTRVARSSFSLAQIGPVFSSAFTNIDLNFRS
jgi:hypothetical protein